VHFLSCFILEPENIKCSLKIQRKIVVIFARYIQMVSLSSKRQSSDEATVHFSFKRQRLGFKLP